MPKRVLLLASAAFAAAWPRVPAADATALGSQPALIVSPADCRRLQAEQTVPSADYVPGMDVRGRAVAPADDPASLGGDDVLRSVDIVIEFDAGPRRTADIAGAGARLHVGTIGFDAAGRVLLDGRPLADAGRRRLLEACARAVR
jgi:hypothetical protein